jgi:hypothetical protein
MFKKRMAIRRDYPVEAFKARRTKEISTKEVGISPCLILDVEKESRHVFVSIGDDGAQRVVRAYKVYDAKVTGNGVFNDSVGKLDGC